METEPKRDEDEPEESGAADTLPATPDEDDETPLGDTDQHSTADA